jgi:folate-binding protein YgfZ
MMSLADQYRIIAAQAGWIDKTGRGRLRVEGRDAGTFLHALLSNDILSLRPGQGAYATYLTPQGRLIADLAVYHRGDHFLADVPPGQAAPLAARLDNVIFTEDVRVSDVSDRFVHLGVSGGAAEVVVARALGGDAGVLRALPVRSHVEVGPALVVRTDDAAVPSLDIIGPVGAREEMVSRLADAGVVEMPAQIADAWRIEAGRPAFGADMTGETIPLEAGLLERAISLEKGCYVGQEVIVRVLHRGGGRVARRLVRLVFDRSADRPPAPGTALSTEAGEVGRVTSAAWSPRLERVVALGYVHRDTAEVGRRVSTAAAGAEITGLAG